MQELTYRLVVYRNIDRSSPLMRLAEIIKHKDCKTFSDDKVASMLLDKVYNIIELGNKYQFDDDLWTNYIVYLIATSENPFTLAAERKEVINDSLKSFALNDFEIFIQLIHYDFSEIERDLKLDCFTLMRNYKNKDSSKSGFANTNVSLRIKELYNEIKGEIDAKKFYEKVVTFYKKYGVGNFGLHKAFRVSQNKEDTLLTPIVGTSDITFSDLIGYEEQKKSLIQNTEAFVNGKPTNNVLLYGDAGTGKSSSVKSLLNMYYEKGLRMIEVYKYDYKYLPEILSIIKDRNYRFIIYLDDLSFEKNETEYKYLKAVIEGGLEVKPENVLVYATSNRVHLLHETFSDRQEVEKDDVHMSDTLAEQTSLASRFGLTIGYFNVKRQEFFDMICVLASENKNLSSINKEELIKRATLWNMYHNDYSGRSARQFIAYLMTE
ncbi:MAG: ATP-binding protein [Lachnospiraceae bacterium]|nr:ATP-binding protein [Lachnospiraceae bacterium]